MERYNELVNEVKLWDGNGEVVTDERKWAENETYAYFPSVEHAKAYCDHLADLWYWAEEFGYKRFEYDEVARGVFQFLEWTGGNGGRWVCVWSPDLYEEDTEENFPEWLK